MERLTTRNSVGVAVYKHPYECERCGEYIYRFPDDGNGSPTDKLAELEDLEEKGQLLRLPCKVGDTVYVDSTMLPIEDMECYEDPDSEVPAYFTARVVSFRFAKRNWMKIAVTAKWLTQWIDDETGPESDYLEYEKFLTILLSSIGKTVFLTREEAEAKLKEMGANNHE